MSGIELNREKLAQVFGVTIRTIDEWVKIGCPGDRPERVGGSWRFNSAEVSEWLRSRERQNALGEIAKIDEHEARKRKLAAEAGMAEHDLAVKQRTAVAVADFDRVASAMVTACRSKLLPLGNKLGPLVAVEDNPLECQSMIDASIHEALQELSEFDTGELQEQSSSSPESTGDGATGSQTNGSAAEADRQRMGGRKSQAEPRGKRGAGPMGNGKG